MSKRVTGYKEVNGKSIEVSFWYQESCRNVYKSVYYYVNGKRVTANKKEIKELLATAPDIVTANCYFWRPGEHAWERRNNEERRLAEVYNWLQSEGFKVTEE